MVLAFSYLEILFIYISSPFLSKASKGIGLMI